MRRRPSTRKLRTSPAARTRAARNPAQTAPVRRVLPALTTRRDIRVRVNGVEQTATVDVRMTLVDFIRERLRLTGTHVGCEHGSCGACTILVDGAAIRSCLMLAVQADGAEITTVEALGTLDRLHPLQEAFRDHHGLQCGFCTPGFLMTGLALLRENSRPTDEEIRTALGGNLCRCTGYQGIVEAMRDAARRMRTSSDS
jgi:carbon-monoxide dehydrogenase small subunit